MSRWQPVARGSWAGLLGGVAMAIAAALLRNFAGIPLLVELVSDRVIPTLSIRRFADLAGRLGGLERGKEVSLLAFFAILVAVGVAAGALYGVVARRGRRRATVGLAVVLAVSAAGILAVLWPVLETNGIGVRLEAARAINVAAIVGLFALYGLVVAAAVGRGQRSPEPVKAAPMGGVAGPPEPSRVPRRALLASAGTVVMAAAAGSLARVVYGRATSGPNGYDGLSVRGPDTKPITPNDAFYVVTKNIVDPRIDRGLWRLEVSGLVERPRSFSFEDITGMPSVEQLQTLECISNGVGGGLMSNAVWRGVRLRDVLGPVLPMSAARFVELHAADGYVNVISLEKALEQTTVAAFEMNGEPLPLRHGFPLRLLVPGTYGEVSVKWIERVALIERYEKGYYAKQGWRPDYVTTTSRIDSPTAGSTVGAGRPVELRGVAFAGDRGVSDVQWSEDAGSTWRPARIVYRPSPLTWALWRATWRPSGTGNRTLTVRAVDGNGLVQSPRVRGTAPAGATGYHRVDVHVGR